MANTVTLWAVSEFGEQRAVNGVIDEWGVWLESTADLPPDRWWHISGSADSEGA